MTTIGPVVESEGSSDPRQVQQLSKWQAKQEPRKNHENNANGLETEALSDGSNQKHGGEENRDAYLLISDVS